MNELEKIKTQIPIYRAKKIDSDEYYEFESFFTYKNYYFAISKIINQKIDGMFSTVMIPLTQKIDPSTLAIHFHDMLDSQGNKIFASLSKDGKGGDTMRDDEYYGIAKYKDSRFVVEYENVEECLFEGNFEIIGIQQ
jgi:hypothetical protein